MYVYTGIYLIIDNLLLIIYNTYLIQYTALQYIYTYFSRYIDIFILVNWVHFHNCQRCIDLREMLFYVHITYYPNTVCV